MSLGTGAAVASAVVALFAAGIAIASAEFSRRQANAAKRQAIAAEDQADAAKRQALMAEEQASAAWEQVAEARRANEAVAADRARMAVQWIATVEPGWESITVRNVGTDTAWDVRAQVGGTDDDWRPVLEQEVGDTFDFEEVRAGDYFPFSLDDHIYPPRQIYVYWRGARQPTAVVVEGSPP